MSEIVKQYLISEADSDTLERLIYMANGYKILLGYLCSQGFREKELYLDTLKQYQLVYAEKEMVFKSICNAYVDEVYLQEGYMIIFNGNISALVIRRG